MKWQTSVGVVVIEQNWLLSKKKRGVEKRCLNLFQELTGIRHRSYSKRCQKLMVDFGIEESFRDAVARMKEHHLVEVEVCAVRKITEHYAKKAEEASSGLAEVKRNAKEMILEMDGEMVPLVKYKESKDRRKTKELFWAELRIGVTQNAGEISWKYASSLGDPNELGDKISLIMKKIGMTEETNVHGVGDGALWIVEQGERIAGGKYKHLIDLYHLSEYLAQGAAAWSKEVKEEVNRFKEMFEKGQNEEVLEELKKKEKDCPGNEELRACIKYIENRPGQFNYKEAKAKGLPLGSGKVESSHRHVMQKRLKKAGTWWLRENAKAMAELRVLRANGGWNLLWQESYEKCSLRKAA